MSEPVQTGPAEKLRAAAGLRPEGATAALVLADGTVLWGRGIGAVGARIGEVCFNTSMTG
ncbi:MAG TPA: carbamoyl-phosphate synthase domain-containing protein, partial [Arenibaculum sp.]|nr:carbamoyl-phosphate synthase domain-containing protein [Arenibaculum sp.]